MSALTDDVVALGRLQARYADAISRRAFSELTDLFRPDTAITIDTVTRAERVIVGPRDFGEFVAAAIERYDHFTFVILNAVVDVDGDGATGRMFMCEVRHDRASDTWQNAHGLYQDRYVRLDDRWWFASRRYRSLARTGPGGEVLGLPPTTWFSG
jgi:SnoaL-like domain